MDGLKMAMASAESITADPNDLKEVMDILDAAMKVAFLKTMRAGALATGEPPPVSEVLGTVSDMLLGILLAGYLTDPDLGEGHDEGDVIADATARVIAGIHKAGICLTGISVEVKSSEEVPGDHATH